MKIIKSKLFLYVIIFVAGLAVGSLFMPPKEVRKEEDVRKISELTAQIKSITKTNEEVVEVVKKDGTKIITTKRRTVAESNARKESSEKERLTKSETIKHGTFGFGPVVTLGKNFKAAGVLADTTLFWRFNIVAGAHYNMNKPAVYGTVGLMFR